MIVSGGSISTADYAVLTPGSSEKPVFAPTGLGYVILPSFPVKEHIDSIE